VNSGESVRATDARTNAELQATTTSALPWIAFTRVSIEVLVLVSMVVLARLIPPSAFGVFALAIIVQELAVTVPGEGVGSALVQRPEVTREHYQTGLVLSLLVGAAFAGLTLILAATVVRGLFGDDAAALVALTTPWFLLGGILALPMAVMRRRLDFRRIAQLDLIQAFVRATSSVLLAAVFGLDALALMFGGLAGICVTVLVACAFARVPLPRWRTQAARDLLPYGVPATFATIALTGFRNGDYAIIGARLGPAQAGLYWRGYQLGVEYQRKVGGVMSQVAFPMLARTLNASDMFALRERMARVATVAVFPLLALLVVLAPVVVPWLFGAQWEAAVVPTQLLAGAGAAMVVIDVAGSVLMAAGRARAVLYWALAHFVIYIPVVLVASRYGLNAVCAAAVGTHVVLLVIAYWALLQGRPERALPLLWRDIRAALLACVALAAVAWPVDLLLGEEGVPPIPRILLVGFVGLIGYVGALRLWFPASARDLAALVRRVVPTAWLRATVRRVPLLADR
jgi:O-antigen/teichoic acid export membrane protein